MTPQLNNIHSLHILCLIATLVVTPVKLTILVDVENHLAGKKLSMVDLFIYLGFYVAFDG